MGRVHGEAAAGLVLLWLLLASTALVRDTRAQPLGEKVPTGGTQVQGTSILVTTNSEGVTEVYVGKPNITITDIWQFISSMNPFSRFPRSVDSEPPLDGTKVTTYYTVVPSPSIYSHSNLGRDSIVLVAPIPANPGKTEGGDNVKKLADYAAYILPKGLSSLPRGLSTQLLTAAEGMKKIGLLVFPPVVGVTGGQPSSQHSPLDAVRIKEIKVLDGDAESAKLDVVLESLGFATPGYTGSPWLILRDVVAEEEAGPPKGKEARAEAGAPDEAVTNAGPFQEYGTIYVNKDGVVTWRVAPYVGRVSYVPLPPFAFPPPIPIPPVTPPMPFPWFNGVPMPNPFYFPFNVPPMPFWNIPHRNPAFFPVVLR